jgi:8-oxo-dGTP diphosphatase
VAAGIIELDGRVLLVENLRRNGQTDWSTPGGVVELGEDPVDGLTREVTEETGITVKRWHGPVYTVTTIAPGMGWHLEVEVHVALDWYGDVVTGADPDGIVIGAAFCDLEAVAANLASTVAWVREPMLEYLKGRWDDPRDFRYHLDGAERPHVNVVRLD